MYCTLQGVRGVRVRGPSRPLQGVRGVRGVRVRGAPPLTWCKGCKGKGCAAALTLTLTPLTLTLTPLTLTLTRTLFRDARKSLFWHSAHKFLDSAEALAEFDP